MAPGIGLALVSQAVPQLDGVIDEGARIADVGSGSRLSIIERARAFPDSRWREMTGDFAGDVLCQHRASH